MARDGPDSARSDFFICVRDQAELDFGGRRNADGQGFAAFGRVVSGMDVVKKIQAAPVREKTQTLAPPIRIVTARAIDAARVGDPGQRPEHDGLKPREDCRVYADARAKRHDDDHREHRILTIVRHA
jgi:hypothetical protein